MTDPHVHFRDWNQSNKETVLHGMETGAKIGFNVFFDMPNTNPPVTNRENAIQRIHLGEYAERELKHKGFDVHYHLYLGITPDPSQIEEMVRTYQLFFPRVCGLKMFASQSTGDMGIVGKRSQQGIYSKLAELGYEGVLAVHCEKEELFVRTASKHADVRPAASEVQSVKDQIDCAEKAGFKGTLHIAHISTAGALKAVCDARTRGIVKITCGATPHHILLNRDKETEIVKMNPPLRDESDRLAVWNGLFDGSVDWIESDHAPHTLEDKQKGASGIPGMEGMLLAIKALREAGMGEDRLNALLGANALEVFGIHQIPTKVPKVTKKLLDIARKAYPISAWS